MGDKFKETPKKSSEGSKGRQPGKKEPNPHATVLERETSAGREAITKEITKRGWGGGITISSNE